MKLLKNPKKYMDYLWIGCIYFFFFQSSTYFFGNQYTTLKDSQKIQYANTFVPLENPIFLYVFYTDEDFKPHGFEIFISVKSQTITSFLSLTSFFQENEI
jgi:hypothetical protein